MSNKPTDMNESNAPKPTVKPTNIQNQNKSKPQSQAPIKPSGSDNSNQKKK